LSVQHAAGRRQAQFAGWLWALYPFAIYFSAAEVWDYSLTSLLFATCFCLAQRLHLQDRLSIWIGFGALYGVAALSNPAVLSLLPILLTRAIWKIRCGHGRRILLGAVCVLSFIAVVGPWIVRNYRVMNAASPIRDGFWLEFWAGNAGDTSESNPAWAHPASNPFEMQLFKAEGESVYLAHKHALAMTSVHSHPLLFVGLSLRRAFRFWTGFWSFRSDYLLAEPFDIPNVFFCGSITLLMIRGLVRLWREDPSRALPYLVLVSIFPIPYYLTHSSMDYRQPIEPQIVVLVAIGILGINDRALSMRSREMNTRAQLRGELQFV
jgi:4-amino-4-deoxy-L-arabinose transferase-like glycosyltransferase